MRRREFLGVLGGAAATWPVVARAQQAMPVVGFLHSATLETARDSVAGFHRGLSEAGYVEGRNVAIEYRFAENQSGRLPALAADLTRRPVTVLFAGGPPAALAAKAAAGTLPVVFTSGADPVKLGLVASLNMPGGNVTGVNLFAGVLGAKRLGLLRDLAPNADVIGVLLNPNGPEAEPQLNDIRAAAQALGQQIIFVNAGNEQDIQRAFTTLVQSRAGALLVGADPFFAGRREQLATLAVRHALPAIHPNREDAVAGGLMSYGTSLSDAYRQAGVYSGRILKGEKPSDLPVVQSTKFELVINLKTAKALGLAVPNSMHLLADEVIE